LSSEHNLKNQRQIASHLNQSGDKYVLNIKESDIDLSKNMISVPSASKVQSNSKINSRSGPLKKKREPDLKMYIKPSTRKDFSVDTRHKFDSFTKNTHSRHYYQSSNHNNSHINESGLSECKKFIYSEKSYHIRQTQGSLSKDKKTPSFSQHRHLRRNMNYR
jgi:hypothetical protein